MAGKRLRDNGTWEYIFKKAGVLPKPIYMTFDTEAEGDAYAVKLEALLKKGIVPTELTAVASTATIRELVGTYEKEAHPSEKDRQCLNVIVEARGHEPLTAINVKWVDSWIRSMKVDDHNSPSTIRAKVGALSRACNWAVRKEFMALPDMPFVTLPNGYSQYSDQDAKLAGIVRKDVERDRRLEPGEHERILTVIQSGVLLRKYRPRTLDYPFAYRLLYILAIESAMRLREMFTLKISQLDIPRTTVFLDKTKNGSKRQVPMSSVVVAELKEYLGKHKDIPLGIPQDNLFPWWDGTDSSLKKLSSEIGKVFSDKRNPGIFNVAECDDLFFHDLRHEATSRLFERTTLTETEIMKITGHKSQKMLLRYANLRASTLAKKLW
jgi:integrase